MIYACYTTQLMRQTVLRDANGEYIRPIQPISNWCWHDDLPISTEHTYIIILSKAQYSASIKLLKNTPKLKILFESVGAYNSVHPTTSSNTVVVFELEQGFKPE